MSLELLAGQFAGLLHPSNELVTDFGTFVNVQVADIVLL